MADDRRTRCMQFLYGWVTKGHLSNLRKGAVEDLEAFVNNELAKDEAARSAAQMQERAEKAQKESTDA